MNISKDKKDQNLTPDLSDTAIGMVFNIPDSEISNQVSQLEAEMIKLIKDLEKN